jgi:nucleoside-diphosphate-sugar epimerase
MIRGKQILLTGGAGFIGSTLAARLVEDNRVVVFDNGHRNAIADTPLLGHPNLRYLPGDVLDAGAVEAAVAGCTHVVHLAAIAGVDTVLRMPVHTMKVSLIGTYNVLEAAKNVPGMERVIDFSTSEVFGTYAYKVREGDLTSLGAVGEARWTYAVSKLATEHLTHNYHVEFGLPAVAIRPFNIYGPGQVGEGAIHRFIMQALRGEDITVHNDGGQIRAWCYVDDMVEGIVRALTREQAVGHSFNIGNPRSIVTVYHLAREVVRIANSPSKIVFIPWGKVDVELRIPDIAKARERLGFEPRVDLEEGLGRTIDWYREKRLK